MSNREDGVVYRAAIDFCDLLDRLRAEIEDEFSRALETSMSSRGRSRRA